MKRTLRLHRETLTELTASDLDAVVGAAPDSSITYSYVPTGCWCTGYNPSLNAPCRTVDCVA